MSETTFTTPDVYAGLGQEVPLPETRIVSRRILLGAAIAAGFATVAGEAEYTDAYVSRAIFSPDTGDLRADTPPELAGKAIDRTNEHYQPDFSQTVTDGIDKYKAGGGKPFYKRPDFYITEWDALKTEWQVKTQKPNGKDPYDVDHPYQRLINFSLINPNLAGEILEIDPGSSTRPVIEQRLQALGAATDRPANPADPLGPTVGDVTILNAYRQTYHQTLDALDAMRGSGQLSTSDLYAHYLQHNNGDMVTSLIDTTLFLKLIARYDVGMLNDPKQNQQLLNPTYANAQELSKRFYDDFSESLPLNALLRVIPKDSQLNNFKIGFVTAEVSKDYDPVNRAGTPYHIWNLMTLVACAHPAAAQEMILSYYNSDSAENNANPKVAQGPIKVTADMHAVNQAHQIRAVFDQYEVK